MFMKSAEDNATKKSRIEQEQKTENKPSEPKTECRRSLTPLFNLKSLCFFCSKEVGCD